MILFSDMLSLDISHVYNTERVSPIIFTLVAKVNTLFQVNIKHF